MIDVPADKIWAGDLFQDQSGAVYVVRAVILEPSVTMTRVLSKDGNPCTGSPQNLTGGCSGLMWRGFRRISSKAETLTKGDGE